MSQNGVLDSEPGKPVFMIHAPEGLHVEARRKMMRKLNAAGADAYHLPEFIAFIQEHPLDFVAVNGDLLRGDQQRVDDQAKVYGRS